MEPIKESIALTLDATGVKANSLSGLIQQLKDVEKYALAASAALNTSTAGIARTAKEIELALQKAKVSFKTGTGSNFPIDALAKSLGATDAQTAAFERNLARRNKAIEGHVKSQRAFRNVPQFAREWAKFEKQTTISLADLLKPGVSKVAGGTVSGGQIKIDGKVDLVIPGALVNASVSGPISLLIAGSQIQGTTSPRPSPQSGEGGQNAPGTGQFTKGNAAGKKKAKAAKGPLDIGEEANEIRRVRTETDKELKEAITVMDEVGNLVTTVHDSVEGIIKTTTRSTTGSTALAQFQILRQQEAEKFRQLKAGLDLSDAGFGLASLQKKQASQLRSMLPEDLAGSLGTVAASNIQAKLNAAADTLDAQAAQTNAKALRAMSTMLEGDLTKLAGQRRADGQKLIHLLRGDLDWVVMKCLEKDRTRRYATATDLALDLQRHLRNEAVLARPPSQIYRFKKLLRRNRSLVFAAGAAFIGVLAGLGLALLLVLYLGHSKIEPKPLEQDPTNFFDLQH